MTTYECNVPDFGVPWRFNEELDPKITYLKTSMKPLDTPQTYRPGPTLLVTLNGSGCGQPGCDCSGRNFITVSDGHRLIVFNISDDDANTIRSFGQLEVRQTRLEVPTEDDDLR